MLAHRDQASVPCTVPPWSSGRAAWGRSRFRELWWLPACDSDQVRPGCRNGLPAAHRVGAAQTRRSQVTPLPAAGGPSLATCGGYTASTWLSFRLWPLKVAMKRNHCCFSVRPVRPVPLASWGHWIMCQCQLIWDY